MRVPAPVSTGDVASCPWLNTSLPISQRVSMLLAKMTLRRQARPDGGPQRRRAQRGDRRHARDPRAVRPRGHPGGWPRRSRRRRKRRDSASGPGQRRGDLGSVGGQGLRTGDRQRGVDQGQHGGLRPDDQHRPRSAVGPQLRVAQRGPVPDRGARLLGDHRASSRRVRSRRSSTTRSTTSRPTATRAPTTT